MIKTKKKILLGAMITSVVGIVTAIWYFSAQDAMSSYGLSEKFAIVLLRWVPGLKAILPFGELVSLLRALAHFVLYLAFGIVATWALSLWNDILSTDWVITIGIILAAMDELHQNFTPGRHACLKDVMIDVLGVCCGIIVFSVLDVGRRALFRGTRL